MKPKYRALRLIISLYKAIGGLLLLLAAIGLIPVIGIALNYSPTASIGGLLIILGAGGGTVLLMAIIGLGLFAVGESLSIGIDIEANTRRLVESVHR